MAGRRRQGRMLALQALFEADSVGHDPEAVLERLVAEKAASETAATFARRLVVGVVGNRGRIDEAIQATAPIWPMEQLATIDRNILRLALYEILINGKTPLKAAINEAVELAKAYGSESSYRFINGVLGNISAQVTGKERR